MDDESLTIGELFLRTLLLGAPAYLIGGAALVWALHRRRRELPLRALHLGGVLGVGLALAFVLTLVAWVVGGLLPDRYVSWWPATLVPEPWEWEHLLFLPSIIASAIAFPLVGWMTVRRERARGGG